MRYISFDADKCVGCQICQLVCSGTWQKVFNPLKANLRIEATGWYGQFRCHVCRQEHDAECVKACPTGALYLDDERGIVQFSRKKCDGCQMCVDACPYGAIFLHPDYEYIFKCNLCGGAKTQECVEACPRDALSLIEATL
jgi:Fe-S-cluster-containing dehydrogenase component